MSRPSSIDKLPPEIRVAIGDLRQRGHTIDEILAHLADMQSAVSRSALGRHIKGLDAIGESMRRSRVVAESLVRELGDAPESKTARLNIELMHSALLDLFMKNADGEIVDAHGKAALAGDPEGVMMLAKALDHLARASKTNEDFIAAAKARATKEAQMAAVKAVEDVAKDAGLTGSTVAMIKAKIFGVKAV
jgi:hypothetical protein